MSTGIAFWGLAGTLLLAALAFLLPALLRGRPTMASGRSRQQLNTEIYRQQFAELERDAALGLISAVDAQHAREELQRRLLEDTRITATSPSAMQGRPAAIGVALLLPLLAVGLYLLRGSPHALNVAPLMASSDDSGSAGVSTLQQHLRSNPRDARGWVLLARAQAESGDFTQSAQSYARAVDSSPNVARDAGVLCEYADVLGMAQGGSLAGRPTELIARALSVDGAHPLALEMAGSAAYEAGDFAQAVRHWAALLPQLQGEPQRQAELAAAIERAQTSDATHSRRRATTALVR